MLRLGFLLAMCGALVGLGGCGSSPLESGPDLFAFPTNADSLERAQIEALTHRLGIERGDPELLLRRGRLKAGLGEPLEALSDYSAALEAAPNHQGVWLAMAEVYWSIDSLSASREALTKLDTLALIELPAAFLSAQHHFEEGDRKGLIFASIQVRYHSPRTYEALVCESLEAWMRGDTLVAFAKLKAAHRRDRRQPQAPHYGLELALLAADTVRAKDWLEAIQASYRPTAHRAQLAEYYWRVGQWETAKSEVKATLARDPANLRALRINLYLANREVDPLVAARAATRLKETDPTLTKADWLRVGAAFERAYQTKEALAAYRLAAKGQAIDPWLRDKIDNLDLRLAREERAALYPARPQVSAQDTLP